MVIPILSDPSLFPYLGYNATSLSIIDCILNTSLFIIFWRKLRYSIVDEVLNKDYETKVNMITNVLIKHTVLFGLALVANQFWYSYIVLNDLIKHQHSWFTDEIIPYMTRALENVINIIVLCLVLKIYYNQYICLCRYCHLCVGNCFMQNHRITIDNPYQQLQSL